jgi:Arc/MetJ family transcription regulator
VRPHILLNTRRNWKLDDKLIQEALELGGFRTKQQAVNSAIAESVQRRRRLRILDLGGKIEFDPLWDYKKMRSGRS